MSSNTKVVTKKEVDSKKKVLDEVSTSYLKLGNSVYTLAKISEEGLDMESELKDFYGKQFDSLVSDLYQGVVSEVEEERDKLYRHLQKYRGRGSITIPPEKYSKLLVVVNSELAECKVIKYEPTESLLSNYDLKSCLTSDKILELTGLSSLSEVDAPTYLVTHKSPFSIPLVVAYTHRTNNLYTPFLQTFHTYSSGGRVCTGNHSASDFWALSNDALEREMNRINWCSPANNTVRYRDSVYSLSSVVRNETVLTINRREAVVWNTN